MKKKTSSASPIYILADMEGASGISRMSQVDRTAPDFAEGCQLLTQDINACIEGAFEGGATEVVVCDTHGGGGNVRITGLDPRVVFETPANGRLLPSLDAGYAGVILLGHHARAGTRNGFLDHTMSSKSWFAYRINRREVGEIGIEAAWAGHYNVPVIMVAGDEATAVEARATLGRVECAVVKRGLSRNRARCLPLARAHAVIRDTTQRAVAHANTFTPFKPKLPAIIEITFYRSDMAEEVAAHPSVERVDARTVRRRVSSLLDICRW